MSFGALVPLLLSLLCTPVARALKVSDVFYVDTSADFAGHCGGRIDRLDAAIDEAQAMAQSALAALTLIRKPLGEAQRPTDWVYFANLYIAFFDPPQRLQGGGVDEEDAAVADPAGLKSSSFFTVRDAFVRLDTTLGGGYDSSKQVFCGDAWLRWLDADDIDPVWKYQNPGAAQPLTLGETVSRWFEGLAPDEGLWQRLTLPPSTPPAYNNVLKYLFYWPKWAPSPICGRGSDATTMWDMDTLTFCPNFFDSHDARLDDAAGAPPAEGMSIGDDSLMSISELWLHELFHFISDLDLPDETAVRMPTGERNDGTRAYGWSRSAALAAWDKYTAQKNVENYVMFAKAVYLRQLWPEWSFPYGYATKQTAAA